ncbi:MAG: hypothetical protein DRP42_03215 [Tenericutes bacterium]|nr:MAG: hypothetical protein DRP42_03215 [Mycoplasmatota bacterium]
MLLIKDWRKGMNIQTPIEIIVQKITSKSPLAIEGNKIRRRTDFMEAMLDLIYCYQDVITVHEQMLFNAYRMELQSITTNLATKQNASICSEWDKAEQTHKK